MQYILQLFTGGFSRAAAGANIERIERKLQHTFGLLDVSDVIFGWHADARLNERVIACIHRHGKRAFLWLPVFSEMPDAQGAQPRIGFSGDPLGAAPCKGDENFNFVCPSSAQNRRFAADCFEAHFANLPYDGVFLDKIRQGGFAEGAQGGVGCLCAACRARYEAKGVDVPALIDAVTRQGACLLPSGRQGARYAFADANIERFFAANADVITEAVATLSEAIHRRGLLVGLDVFAPALAWFVGQDIPALSACADFIKPMMYRITDAPAGLPYETGRMGADAGRVLARMWGADVCSQDAMRAQCVAAQSAACPVYPGFEINRLPGICPSDPAYVRGCKALFEGLGAQKLVLAWNLLEDTGDNIAALL